MGSNVSSTFYLQSLRGNRLLMHDGVKFIRNNKHNGKIYWKCTRWHAACRARAITSESDPCAPVKLKNHHNHSLNESGP